MKAEIKVNIGEGLCGWVAKHKKPLISNDVQNDSRFLKQADKATGFRTRNILCVPLIYQQEILGVLNVLNSKHRQLFDREDEEILLSYAHLVSVAIVRSRLISSRLQQQRLEIQMTTAATIQSIFQPEIPELGRGSHAWAISLPASFVGGDLYDFLPMVDGSWIIYVADVSDKGLPAALVMVALWSQIRSEVSLHSDIKPLLEAVNKAMFDLLANEGFFATIILGRYWPENGRLSLVRGGHLPPLRIKNGALESMPTLGGFSLGIAEQVTFTSEEIILLPGESVLFLSDGVTEAKDSRNKLFGVQRLEKAIKQTSQPPWGSNVLSAVRKWQGATEQNDDLTILEIWRDDLPAGPAISRVETA